MSKRPCCVLAIVVLLIQFVLVGGFQISRDLKPSYLETNYEQGETILVQGKICRREKQNSNYIYCLKDISVYRAHIKTDIKREKILVFIESPNSISIGSIIQITGKIQFFQEDRNPGNFNQKFYYQKQQIHAQVRCSQFQIKRSHINRLTETLTGVREDAKTLLIQALGEEAGNSMSAILLGDKKDLDSDIKQLYQKGGIGHILAISGLHMSFIGIGLYHALRKVGCSFAVAGISGIFLLSFYTLMIGAGISSIRAIIMYIVRMGAEITGRDYDLLTSLSIAATIIVLWQPLYLFDAGFLFSFGAILAIALIHPILEQNQWIPSFLCGGIAIQVMLLPLTMYFYFEIPLWSVFTNLIVIPLMSVLLAVGITGLLFLYIWLSIGQLVLQICKGILWIYENLCQFTVNFPFGRVVTGKPEKWMLCLYYCGLLISYLFWINQRRQAEKEIQDCTNKKELQETEKVQEQIFQQKCNIFILQTVFWIALIGILLWINTHKKGNLELTMLDVGQGDCIYIRTPNGSHCLVDGGSTDVSKIGQYRIIPFLESKGVGQLDYVFISHGDEDHINGIEEMLQNQALNVKIKFLVLPPKNVWDDKLTHLTQIAVENQTQILIITEGKQLKENRDGTSFTLTCKAPSDNYTGETGNEASMVLDLHYKTFDMLFTGDLEKNGETQLIQNADLTSYDILKVAHHGSKNATSEQLLQLTTPSTALISAGLQNRYGHPHQETIERLEKQDISIYNTQIHGAIYIQTDGKKLKIKCFAK